MTLHIFYFCCISNINANFPLIFNFCFIVENFARTLFAGELSDKRKEPNSPVLVP